MADDLAFRIRVTGAIVRDEKILLVKCDEEGFGEHYNLPGGGLDIGEPVMAGVRREMREELDVDVEVGELVCTGEFIGEHHSVFLVFHCHLKPGDEPRMPAAPDTHQIGVEWVSLHEIDQVRLLPNLAADIFDSIRKQRSIPFRPNGTN